MADFIMGIATSLFSTHPAFASLLMVVGILRLVMKPLMVFIETLVIATPSKLDDDLYQKMIQSELYKAFVFMIDWLASIKLPKK
jgi:hypothetical protein